MKRILSILLALLIIVPTTTLEAATPLEKARSKEYKQKTKEYKKEGWKIYGTSHTLEVALLSHYETLNNQALDAQEVVGVASAFKSKNVGRQTALNNAAVAYASAAGSSVKDRVVSDIYSDADRPEAEFDKFYAAYERLVEKEIRGELAESYSVIRENKDGTYEMQSYFIVSQDKATQARMRAYENALKESEMAEEYARKVSDFIREGFDMD